MESRQTFYMESKEKMMKTFTKLVNKHLRNVLSSSFDDPTLDQIIQETTQEFEGLLPQLPEIGGKKNPYLYNFFSAAGMLALYPVLKRQGMTTRECGELVYKLGETFSNSIPWIARKLAGKFFFTNRKKRKTKEWAAESQKRYYPNNWVLEFVEGDGKDFEYGINIMECAICKLYRAHGAEELLPYLCLVDYPMFQAIGVGMKRTQTLALGAPFCDFRYVKDYKTLLGWPPENLKEFQSQIEEKKA